MRGIPTATDENQYLISLTATSRATEWHTGVHSRSTMVISTHVYAEHPNLALSETIRSHPEVQIDVLPEVGTDPHHDDYLFWIEAPDFASVEATLENDRSVTGYTQVAELADRRTYRIAYDDDAELLTPVVTEAGGITQEARSHERGWVLRLQLPTHDALTELDRYADERGIHLEILDLRHRGGTTNRLNHGLTEAQTEALVAAYVHGYYDEPREFSLEQLARTLDISTTAASGRLRRGSARLIEDLLLSDTREDESTYPRVNRTD